MPYFAPVLFFIAFFLLAFGVITAGLARTSLILGITAAGVIGVVALEKNIVAEDAWIYVTAATLALVAGASTGIAYENRTQIDVKDRILGLFRGLTADYRIRVIIISILVAIIITTFFASFARSENPRGFWYAFYPSWTASLVFFAILGMAGTVVAFYRPEKDEFYTRVRILCGGRDDPTVDYIREKIRRLGYYAVSVSRHYKIMSYDSTRDAYQIEVTHTSVNRNFYDDEAIDFGHYSMVPDKFNPPLESPGTLLYVKVDGGKIVDPENIPSEGIQKDWKVEIEKGRSVEIEYAHRMWYLCSEKHKFRPSRFSREISINVTYDIPGEGADVTWNAYNRPRSNKFTEDSAPEVREKTRRLWPAVKIKVDGPITNIFPDEVAIALRFSRPKDAAGAGSPLEDPVAGTIS